MSKEVVDRVFAEFSIEYHKSRAANEAIAVARKEEIKKQIGALSQELAELELRSDNSKNTIESARVFLETLDELYQGNATHHMLWMNMMARFNAQEAAPAVAEKAAATRKSRPQIDSDLKDKVLSTLTREPMGSADVAKALGMETAVVSRALANLIDEGLVLTQGNKRAKVYMLPTPVEQGGPVDPDADYDPNEDEYVDGDEDSEDL